jgi:hypothetical protein
MRKTVLLVLMVSMLLLGPAVFAQDKPADQSGSSQPAAGRRFSELSPEEQAKLRAKWQSASPEEKAKARETARAAGTAQGPQSQMRKELLQAEINKLQEQHKMSVGELQAVKQIAVKENAKETAEALTRMKALQGDKGAQTGEAGQTPAGKAKTPESKKNGAKSQSTGTKK